MVRSDHQRKPPVTLNKFRGWLYGSAKGLGDAQAVLEAVRTTSAAPIAKRVGRRVAGYGAGRLLGKLFRP